MPAGDSTQRAWVIEATCHGVQIDFSHLQCVIKENNKYNKDAVAPMKDETIVGHVPAEPVLVLLPGVCPPKREDVPRGVVVHMCGTGRSWSNAEITKLWLNHIWGATTQRSRC